MDILKKTPTNYVTYFYLLNILFGIFIVAFEDNKPIQYSLSCLLILFFGFGGYLNGKTGKSLTSICWVFFLNLFIGICGIYVLEILGATFHIFGGSKGGDSILIVLFQYAINFYLAPYTAIIEDINETLPIIFIVICSFIIPFVGYKLGVFKKNKSFYEAENS